jgi:hypothetical protein
MLSDTGFETHRGACWNVEPVSVRDLTIELQGGVGLRQVNVTAHLDGPIAVVDDVELDPFGTLVDHYVAVAVDDLSWDHWLPLLLFAQALIATFTGSGDGR